MDCNNTFLNAESVLHAWNKSDFFAHFKMHPFTVINHNHDYSSFLNSMNPFIKLLNLKEVFGIFLNLYAETVLANRELWS